MSPDSRPVSAMAGAEDPDQEQDPRRDQRQRAVLAAQAPGTVMKRAADGADDHERQARERRGQARIDHGDGDQRQLRDDPHRDQHADQAVPEREPQEHGEEDRRGSPRARIRPPRGRRRCPRAASGTACGRSRSRRRGRPARTRRRAPRSGRSALWLAAKIAVRKIASRPVRPSMMPLNSWRSRDLELVVERLPQVDAREAVGRQLGDVGDGLPRLERDAEDVGAVALDALGHEADGRRHRLDAARVEIGPDDARADDVVALRRQPALDRLVGRVR